MIDELDELPACGFVGTDYDRPKAKDYSKGILFLTRVSVQNSPRGQLK
jgi:hypothetical protein